MLNVKLIGAFGERNFGDDLLLAVAVKLIAGGVPVRRLGIAATAPAQSHYIRRIAPQAELVARLHPMPARWDAEIFAGGNQFYSFPGAAAAVEASALARLRARMREEGALHFVARHALRRMLPRPRGFAVGIGIGPFESGNEQASRRVVAELEQIWIRDERSKSDLERWGLDNYSEGADLCFASAALEQPPLALPAPPDASVRTVGVVVRGWDYRTAAASYEHTLLRFIEELRGAGGTVRLISFCEPADRAVIAWLRERGENVTVWDPEVLSVADFLHELKRCDLLLSTRFHGVVIAALLGVPVVGLALDPKVSGICSRLGIGDFVWDGAFTLEHLRTLFTNACAQRESMCARMEQAVRIERARADAMVAAVIERLCAL